MTPWLEYQSATVEAMSVLFGRPRAQIAPGAVHVPGWLSDDEQRELVAACREWAKPPAGIRHTAMPTGGVMSVQTVCLGWHWVPYRYSADRRTDGAPVKPFPDWLADLGRRAVADAYAESEPAIAASYRPDVALVNFYDGQAKMGMHADKDERSPAPVVSLSLGATCVFRFGNTASRNRPWQDVGSSQATCSSSAASRACLPRRAQDAARTPTGPQIGLPSGRLNITLRESGLGESGLGESGLAARCLRVTPSGGPPPAARGAGGPRADPQRLPGAALRHHRPGRPAGARGRLPGQASADQG